MDIDMSVLRALERDKDIPFDALVVTIEQALLNIKSAMVFLPRRGRARGVAPWRGPDQPGFAGAATLMNDLSACLQHLRANQAP
jgi:hypothetical protein